MHLSRIQSTRSGFTIVELLIVIVVIAILATISIVAYNGIQNRAKASQATAALTQAKKKLELYKVDNANYPTTGNLASAGVTDNTTTYQYTSDGSSYCLTATAGNVSYKATNTDSPAQGGCAGHGQGGVAAITNLAENPSSESNVLVLNSGGGTTTATRLSTEYHDGAYSTRLYKFGEFAYVATTASNIPVSTGDVIVTCAWVKSSVSPIRFARRGASIPYSTSPKSVSVNSWTNICDTYTIPSGGTSFHDDLGWEKADVADGATVYIDGIMITKGSTQYNFADGNSPNWIWNGTPNNSTSTGPPL